MFRKTLFAAALLGILAPVAANAETIEVRYGDLDLTSSKERVRLDTRIRMAAKKVCEVNYAYGLAERNSAWTCVRAALASAQPQVARAYEAADQRLARAGAGISVEGSAVTDS